MTPDDEARWRMQERLNRPLRSKPSKEQRGTADLPLFQTDIEEFTGPEASHGQRSELL